MCARDQWLQNLYGITRDKIFYFLLLAMMDNESIPWSEIQGKL